MEGLRGATYNTTITMQDAMACHWEVILRRDMKIAINKCWGGFVLSKQVYDEMGIKWDGYGYLTNEDLEISSDNYNAYRSDKRLIKAIEKIGNKESSGDLAKIVIVEIPDGIDFEIENYDGMESIHEKHRSW